MKDRIVVTGTTLLAAAVLSLVVVRWAAPARSADPPRKGHFMEVGKTYTFIAPGVGDFAKHKVLEEPRDGWVKTQLTGGTIQWVNLARVTTVNLESTDSR
jgi:hypothetical protein